MEEPLLRIDGAPIASGLFPDLKQQSSPIWEDGQNILFRGGKIQPFPGHGLLSAADDWLISVRQISGLANDGRPGAVLGSLHRLYVWDEVNGMRSLGDGYSKGGRWSFEQWGKWLIAANGRDQIQSNRGGKFNPIEGASAVFDSVEIVIKWRTFLFAFNSNVDNNSLYWCHDDDIDTWLPTAGNMAGSMRVRDVEDGIKAALYLGNNLVFYGLDEVHSVFPTRDNDVFGHTRLIKGVGALGKNAVASFSGRHFGVGPRGIWVHDGSSFDYIDNSAVRERFMRRVNKDHWEKTVCYYDQLIKHIVIYFPGADETEPSEGLAYNVEERNWTVLSFGRSAASDIGLLPWGISTHRQKLFRHFTDLPLLHDGRNVVAPREGWTVSVGWGHGGWGQGGWGGKISADS